MRMYCVKPVTGDLWWVGGNDRRIALFENVYPVPEGVSYNAYLLLDEKTVLLDTVDRAVSAVFFENLEHLLAGRKLDYLVVNHMEPDHAATIQDLVLRYPEVRIVCNAKTQAMMHQFFTFDIDSRVVSVKEGDTLNSGRHVLSFVMAPMVHWPEVMMTYDQTDGTLFSADAFGSFGALGGNLFSDEVDQERAYMDEARRYYTNIVGKYGNQVQAILKKAAGLNINRICPLHGLVFRTKIGDFVEKYRQWSAYEPEQNAVVIAYASVYGNTANAAEILAGALAERGVRDVRLYDVSVTDPSYLVAEAFRCSHLVFASTTYNAGVFVKMENLLHDLAAHNLQNRTVAFIENGSWAATSGKLMAAMLSGCKNMTVLDGTVSLRSSVKPEQREQLQALAQQIVDSFPRAQAVEHAPRTVDPSALFQLTYGLFVLTARQDGRDNGCIINTVCQLTDEPKRMTIAVNKANLTHDMIAATGVLNVSVLTQEVPMRVIEHFGFQSGRNAEKFAGCTEEKRSGNGLIYLPKYTNAYLSGRVVESYDYGTHTLFVCEITEAERLADAPSVSYEYYREHIKPKPQKPETGKTGWVCKVCGWVYEGEELPEDLVCPLCKHGAADFEPLK